MSPPRLHTPWLALLLALAANVLWFGLLAAAQHRAPQPISTPTIPAAQIIYEAPPPPQPGPEAQRPEASSATPFLQPASLPTRETRSEQPWPVPAPRLQPSGPNVSLVLAPPNLTSVTPAALPSRGKTTGPSVDRLPVLLTGTPPGYPGWAKRAGLMGHVQLRFVVTAAGRVQDIEVLHTEGDTRFGPHAARKISTWRFEPARKDGRAVAYRCLQTIHFQPRP